MIDQAERRAFVLAYAEQAVKSGRLNPMSAVREALTEWERKEGAAQAVAEAFESIENNEMLPCPSCHAEPGGIHHDSCEVDHAE